jgi:cell volume regulation protein A
MIKRARYTELAIQNNNATKNNLEEALFGEYYTPFNNDEPVAEPPMEIAPIIIFVGLLVFLAHYFVALFERTRVPDVLYLILIGLILGPIFRIVTPEDFGKVGSVFTTVALVIILFEGGTGVRTDVIQKSWKGSVKLTITSFLLSMTVIGLVVYSATPFGVIRSFMVGAIVGGTASAVVVPLVRQLTMTNESKAILILESVATDVMCIVVALGFFEAYRLGELRVGVMIGQTVAAFLLAAILGTISAFGWSIVLRKVRTLQFSLLTTPAFVFIVYGVVEMFGYSGAIAALAFGFAIGNTQLFRWPIIRRYVPREPISLSETEKILFGEFVFILKTFFFVYLGISIQLTALLPIIFGFILTLLLFVVRIPVAWLAVDRTTPISDASLIAVMGPRGLAAAVLASLPLQLGIEGGEFIQNVTYSVVLFSVILNSVMIFLLEKTVVGKWYDWLFVGYGIPPVTETNPIGEAPTSRYL